MGICGCTNKDEAIIANQIVGESLESDQKGTKEEEKKANGVGGVSSQDKHLMFQLKSTSTNSQKDVNANPVRFKRNDKSHLTVKMNINNQKLKVNINEQNTNSTNINSTNTNKTKENSGNSEEPAQKFQRRNKKSTTLVEKSKSSELFKDELQICVLKQTLIGDAGENPSEKYKIIKKLGEGSYGVVYLVNNTLTNTKVTMKKIIKIKENIIDNLEIKNEIEILRKLDHPNIVKIIEYFESKDAYYIITEYCEKGELYGYIKNEYSEKQLAVLFYQVFSGLVYLHDNNIFHRDIKLENILISEIEKDLKTSQQFFWIKIIDFGTAKIFRQNKRERAIVGSSYYIAPEVLKKNYNEKCDTWSVGVILYMLIVGRAPFDGKDDDEIIASIKKGVFNSKHKKLLEKSQELQDLLLKLLDVNTSTRLSAREALDHPWFKKLNGRFLYSNFEVQDVLPIINNLFGYSFQSKFQQLVLAFVVHNIPISSQTKLIHKLFRYFNVKGDCKLTKAELSCGMEQFRPKNEVQKCVDDIFLLLDGDNNGYIEYEEFLRACLNKREILTDANLQYAFDFLDKEKTKNLSAKVIMSSFVVESNPKLEEIFQNTINEVDDDHDGLINFEEFKELMLDVS